MQGPGRARAPARRQKIFRVAMARRAIGRKRTTSSCDLVRVGWGESLGLASGGGGGALGRLIAPREKEKKGRRLSGVSTLPPRSPG